MPKVRRLAAAAIIPFALLSLCACTPEVRVEASIKGDQVVFAICDPIDAQSVRVDGYPSARASDSHSEEVVWQIAGSDSWPAGYELTLGEAPEGWDTKVEAIDIDLSSDEIYLALNSPADTTADDTRVATFDPSLLEEGNWLSQTGGISDLPCA